MLEIATRPLEIEIFMNKFAIRWRDFPTQFFFSKIYMIWNFLPRIFEGILKSGSLIMRKCIFDIEGRMFEIFRTVVDAFGKRKWIKNLHVNWTKQNKHPPSPSILIAASVS